MNPIEWIKGIWVAGYISDTTTHYLQLYEANIELQPLIPLNYSTIFCLQLQPSEMQFGNFENLIIDRSNIKTSAWVDTAYEDIFLSTLQNVNIYAITL